MTCLWVAGAGLFLAYLLGRLMLHLLAIVLLGVVLTASGQQFGLDTSANPRGQWGAISGSASTSLVSQVWVDLWGNDANSGGMMTPYATLQRGLQDAYDTNQLVVHLGAGTNRQTTSTVITNNVAIIGLGKYITTFGSTNKSGLGPILSISGSNVVIQGMTVTDFPVNPTNDTVAVPIGAESFNVQADIIDVRYMGQSDGIVISDSTTNHVRHYDCVFTSHLDNALFLGADGLSLYEFYNCQFPVTGPPDTNNPANTSAIRFGGVTVYVQNCTFWVTNNCPPVFNGATAIASVYADAGTITLDNSTITTSSPTNALDIDLLNGGDAFVRNSVVDPDKVLGSVTWYQSPPLPTGGTGPTSITFPASTVNWTNTTTTSIELYIDNVGITGTAITKNGTQILGGLITGYTMILVPGDYFSETYTIGSPTAKYNALTR